MRLLVVLFIIFSSLSRAEDLSWSNGFKTIYQQELGTLSTCNVQEPDTIRVCSEHLRNEGNAPFILHHGQPTDKVMVLFHGLSDSPFFFRSIAPFIHQQGYTVVVGLLPGHGKKDANDDMEDGDLDERWQNHVADVIGYASSLGSKLYVGGFSTGGALVTDYVFKNPGKIDGILLFSGALELDSSAESMSRWWIIRQIAKWKDGDYQTDGANPYKYPRVASFAATKLVAVIDSIRDQMEQQQPLDVSLFVAHSAADTTTLLSGVEQLMAYNKGQNTSFIIEKDLDVCHADIVVNEPHLEMMQFDESKLEDPGKCRVPQANPKHAMMMQSLVEFLKSQE